MIEFNRPNCGRQHHIRTLTKHNRSSTPVTAFAVVVVMLAAVGCSAETEPESTAVVEPPASAETAAVQAASTAATESEISRNAATVQQPAAEVRVPQGSPASLRSLPAPDLRSMSSATSIAQKGSTLAARPTSSVRFPRQFAGLYFGHLDQSPRTGFAWLEIEFETVLPEPPERHLPRHTDPREEQKTRQEIEKLGTAALADHLVQQLPHSCGASAKKAEGTIRVFRIGNPNLDPHDRGYLEVQKKEVDSTPFSGWIDENERLISIRATHWKSGTDKFIVSAIRNLHLSGYWIPEKRVIKGWSSTAGQHFAVTSHPAEAEALLKVGIARGQNPTREEMDAKREFDRMFFQFKQLESKKETVERWTGELTTMEQGSSGRERLQSKIEHMRDEIRRSNVPEFDIEPAVRWLQPLLTPEHTDMFDNMKSGDLPFRCISLLSSPHFAACFGKAIEQLGYVDRIRVQHMIRAAVARQPQKDPRQGYDYFAGALAGLEGALNDRKYSETVSFVSLQRAKHQWLDSYMARNRPAATYKGAFQDFEYTEPWRTLSLQGRLPSQKEKPHEALAQIRHDRAVAELESWDNHSEKRLFSELLSAVGEELAAKYRTRAVEMANDRLLTQLIDDFEDFTKIRDDAAAIRPVGEWIRHLTTDFRSIQHSDEYKAAWSFAQKRQQRLLETYLPNLIHQLDTATDETAVKLMRRWALPRGEFKGNSESQQIEQAIQRNLARLERERSLRFFSPQELQWIVGDSLKLTVPDVIPEPTAESIRFAIYREMGHLPGSKWETPESVQLSIPPADRLGLYSTMTITDVAKVVDPEGRTALQDGQGFLCYFRVMPKIEPGGDAKTRRALGLTNGSPQKKLFDLLGALAQAEARLTTLQDVFVLTEDGWRSPSIRRRGIGGLLKAYQAAAGGVEAATEPMSTWPIAYGRVRRVKIGNRIYHRYVTP